MQQSVNLPADFKLLSEREILSEQKKMIDAGHYDIVRFAAHIERLTLQRAGVFTPETR